jgi:hypothetical protein
MQRHLKVRFHPPDSCANPQYIELVRDTRRIGEGRCASTVGTLLEAISVHALEFIKPPDSSVVTQRYDADGVCGSPESKCGRRRQAGGNGHRPVREAASNSNVNARAQAVRMVAEDTDLYC